MGKYSEHKRCLMTAFFAGVVTLKNSTANRHCGAREHFRTLQTEKSSWSLRSDVLRNVINFASYECNSNPTITFDFNHKQCMMLFVELVIPRTQRCQGSFYRRTKHNLR